MTQKKKKKASALVEQTRESLEFSTVLDLFACRTQTQEGLKSLLALDLMEPQEQSPHFEALEQWVAYLAENPVPRFPTIPDPKSFKRVPELNPFEKDELRVIRDVLLFRMRLLADDQLAFAQDGLFPHDGLDQLTGDLEQLFGEDGDWSPQISPKYASLVSRLKKTKHSLEQTMRSLTRNYGDYLNETIIFERNNRLCLAVQQNFKGRVRGILQDYSSSGNTVYMEPEESVGLQNSLTQIQLEIEQELWRIRCEVTRKVLEFQMIANVILPAMARIDMMQALARSVGENRCQLIQPNHKRSLKLYNARHPFLDEAFAKERMRILDLAEQDKNRMVAINLHLDQETRGLVISGANTGGKTVTLKTTGLMAWMANSGLPIPVEEGSEVPYYRSILADIGDHQSLSHNLSTFASHLVNMNEVLSEEGDQLLVLLDELGSGTDPQEGNALAQAMIEDMSERGLHLLVTTHQQILCTMALTHPNLENGSMIFDNRALRPTYRFTQGVPGRSHALDTAANSGLKASILARAKQLIADDQVDIQAAIRQLQEQHKQLRKQQQKLRKEELRLHRRIQETRAERDNMKQQQQDFEEKSRVKLKKTVEKAEKELRSLLADIESQKQRRTGVKKFAQLRQDLLPDHDTPKKLEKIEIETTNIPPTEWAAGDRVYLKTWLKEANLISCDKKKARIDVNGKVMTVNIQDLLHLKQKEKPKKVTQYLEESSDDALSLELRLLGFRVEDALMELEQTIDRAMRRGVPFIKIIHGHGSGALKQAVREYLRHHIAKSSFSVIVDRENDGVTDIKFDI